MSAFLELRRILMSVYHAELQFLSGGCVARGRRDLCRRQHKIRLAPSEKQSGISGAAVLGSRRRPTGDAT